jgi:hypothetical protein
VAAHPKPSAEVLTTATRTNLSARICHRVDTVEDFLHLFPDDRELDVWDVNGWKFNVTRIGLNGKRHYDHRYSSGKWSGWTTKRIR